MGGDNICSSLSKTTNTLQEYFTSWEKNKYNNDNKKRGLERE